MRSKILICLFAILLGSVAGAFAGVPDFTTPEAVAAVESGGGKVLLAAQDTDFGRFAVLADPWGASFSVMQELSS